MADVESSSARQPFCVWSEASRNFAIHIPPDVIGSLGTESLLAFKRVPRRGLETGGILLGRTEFLGDTTTFWIEGFAPIECEHRFGPSYLLSDSDLAHLQTELTRKGTASLGIYRSQTRSEQLEIQDADVALFDKCFGVSDKLFLMLAPLTRIGAFYFREDGNLKCIHQFTVVSSLSSVATQGRTPSPHVNLPSSQSAGTLGVHANIARHTADQAGALVVASPRSEQKAPPGALSAANGGAGYIPSKNAGARLSFARWGLWMSQTSASAQSWMSQTFAHAQSWITAIRRWTAKLWSDCSGRSSGMKLTSWVLAAVTLAVLTANLLSYSFRRSATPDRRALNYLYLTVEQAGPALRLLWDGNSTAVRGASRAVLHIQDGDQQSDKELTASELLAGQFTYQPQHSAVTFRLNVYAGEPNATGLVQVIFPPPPIEPPPQPAQNSQPIAQPPIKSIVRAEVAATPSSPTMPSNENEGHTAETQLQAVNLPEPSKISPLPPTRQPSLAPGTAESGWHSLTATRNDIRPLGRELTVRASTTPVPASRLGRLFGKIPLVGRLRKPAKAVEAVAVHQAQPIVRMPGDQQLLRPVAVGVKVSVSESGVVNDAEVVDYGDDPLSPTLANAALAAARNWTFTPPQVDDTPVASQLIIHFYFSP